MEISTTAIASARRSALEMNIPQADFYAADVEIFLDCNRGFSADLVVVNPPRRGLSPKVLEHIERLAPSSIIYSSCNPQTFCSDVKALSERYKLQQITPFDMFPLTYHWEILGLLTLR